MTKKTVLLLLLALAAAPAAMAAEAPVEITAAQSLEWDRKAMTYTARGKVVMTQGAAKIQSDLLVARYAEAGGAPAFSTLEASGHVVLQSPPYTASGDRATYDVKTGNAVLTGEELKITTGEDLMAAEDKIEFFGAEQRLTASGNATATHGSYILTADSLSVYFDKNAAGKMAAKKITARGNVVIRTGKETITGDEGVYDVAAQKAVLTGKVMVRQEQSWLEGTSAHVDMATGISQLLGGGGDKEGRVKGVFYPETAPTEKEKP